MPVLGPVRCDDGLLGLRCRLIRMAGVAPGKLFSMCENTKHEVASWHAGPNGASEAPVPVPNVTF